VETLYVLFSCAAASSEGYGEFSVLIGDFNSDRGCERSLTPLFRRGGRLFEKPPNTVTNL
jgi:hypothetical protein